MAFEWWWLLAIPLLFSLGWLAGHLDKRQTRREQEELPRSYFRALNYLLNEQPDRAVDAFLEVVRLSPETVELHLALGNLFRQRGEPDRAIRVHQNLLERTDLSMIQREHTSYELGQDFVKAGLIDRAESTLKTLLAGSYAVPASRTLLNIYESTRDWAQALEVGLNLPSESPAQQTAWANRLAHIACELASESVSGLSDPRAEQALAQAEKLVPGHVRVRVLRARDTARRADWQAAIDLWDEIAAQSPPHLALFSAELALWIRAAAPDLSESLHAQLKPYLLRWSEQYPCVELLDLQLQAEPDSMLRQQLLQKALHAKPGAMTVQRLLQNILGEATSEVVLDAPLTQSCVNALRQEAQRQPRYVCMHCGFKSLRHTWQCPGCQNWDQLLPVA